MVFLAVSSQIADGLTTAKDVEGRGSGTRRASCHIPTCHLQRNKGTRIICAGDK